MKDGVYVVNLDDKKNTTVYLDSFGIGYIPQEVLDKI